MAAGSLAWSPRLLLVGIGRALVSSAVLVRGLLACDFLAPPGPRPQQVTKTAVRGLRVSLVLAVLLERGVVVALALVVDLALALIVALVVDLALIVDLALDLVLVLGVAVVLGAAGGGDVAAVGVFKGDVDVQLLRA